MFNVTKLSFAGALKVGLQKPPPPPPTERENLLATIKLLKDKSELARNQHGASPSSERLANLQHARRNLAEARGLLVKHDDEQNYEENFPELPASRVAGSSGKFSS